MKVTYENARRILEQLKKIDRRVDPLENGIIENVKQITKAINQAVMKNAEELGCSVYDICFRTIPRVHYETEKIGFPITPVEETFFKVELEPVEFELEKGPGYWKNKYLCLKEKMSKLIDKEDE